MLTTKIQKYTYWNIFFLLLTLVVLTGWFLLLSTLRWPSCFKFSSSPILVHERWFKLLLICTYECSYYIYFEHIIVFILHKIIPMNVEIMIKNRRCEHNNHTNFLKYYVCKISEQSRVSQLEVGIWYSCKNSVKYGLISSRTFNRQFSAVYHQLWLWLGDESLQNPFQLNLKCVQLTGNYWIWFLKALAYW